MALGFRWTAPTSQIVPDMSNKTVVITGANSGIGKITASALATAGADVILACRNLDTAQVAQNEILAAVPDATVTVEPLDLMDLASVHKFSEAVADRDRIDVLINNAGFVTDALKISPQGYESMFATNHLGHFLLTHLLMPQLEAAPSARVINVASAAHLFAPRGISWNNLDRHFGFNHWQTYGETKLANILFTNELARRLGESSVVTHSLHPGNISSGFGKSGMLQGFQGSLMNAGAPFLLTPVQGAQTSIFLAAAVAPLATTGRYWANMRPARRAPWAKDATAERRLWRLSMSLLGDYSPPTTIGVGR